MPLYLLFPLGAAVVYALGSICIKRALKEGASMDQTFHVSNFVLGAMFLPLAFFEKQAVDWSLIWEPLVMGIVFFVGNWLTFVGLRRGDVSLVTPLMGTKVVFVALGITLLTGRDLSPALWLAAILTTVGILAMGGADFAKGRHLAFTIVVALASAAFFGLNDTLVNWWAPGFGPLTFLALGSGLVALFSAMLWLGQGRPSLRLPRSAGKWAWLGALCIALQAILIGVSLAFYPDATGINVVYASRGLWVIVLVVVLGAVLGNSEHRETGRGFLWRVGGTVILTAAIVIAVIDRARAEAVL